MNLLNLANFLKQETGFTFTIPPKLDLGVLTTNQAFIEAKKQGKNPIITAQEISININQIFADNKILAEAKVVGPYINISLQDKFMQSLFDKESYLELPQIDESFCLDMFHPNVGKKMHVGHMRSGNLGESMRRILSLKYAKVIADNHLGDWGIQFSYTSWGILNLDKLELDFNTIDIGKEEREVLINKFYQIYVKVNKMLETDEIIAKICKANAKLLEKGLQNLQILSLEDQVHYNTLHDLFTKIVTISLTEFTEAEKYLNLNQNPNWLPVQQLQFTDKQMQQKNQVGCHILNQSHVNGKFDMILGESFFIPYLPEFDYWVTVGLAKKEGEAIYIDLEEQKLGRCYLISSEGYSLYHSRDIINRMIYAGIFEFDNTISFADSRQKHSFEQVFAVLRILINSNIYTTRQFGLLSQEETLKALTTLNKKMSMFEGFGHFNLPEGTMSTRKGKIFAFAKLQQMLDEKVRNNLNEKGVGDITNEKVQNIAVAALKWADLQRDREQDVVFDVDSVLKFEGNTGVYQLYTLARLSSILEKNINHTGKLQVQKLNQTELKLLNTTFTLPIILESITQNFKPHNLTNHLFELSSEINSWYAKYSVNNEMDLERKESLLALCQYLVNYLEKGLSLVGINSIEKL